MDAQRIEEITEWDGRSFSDGFAGLRRLADRGFSGAATNGTGWLFMLNGRVVGTVDAELDAFADASGTVYKAPEEVLPLLFAMQERGGEKRAQYYTNDTPLSEADRKLSEGGFTGYVELSENVLSGDYYVTYTAGESRAAAFVGNSRRVETGEDAFDLADDEVGIYSVYEVDLDVREIPEPQPGTVADDDETEPAADDGATGDGSGPATEGGPEPATEGGPEPATEGGPEPVTGDESGSTAEASSDRDVESDPDHEPERGIAADTDEVADTGSDASPDESGSDENGSSANGTDRSEPPRDGTTTSHGTVASASESAAESAAESASDSGHTVAEAAADDDVFSEEAEWREAKSIPALDPSEASERPDSRSNGPRRTTNEGRNSPEPRSTGQSAGTSAVSERSSVQRSELNRELQRLKTELEETESALSAAESDRDSLAEERDELAAERDRLQSEVETLESEIDGLESEMAELESELERTREELAAARPGDGNAARSLSAAEARSQTNLFIRYDSKGGVTLDDVHDGDVDSEALEDNLRIEHHTGFDSGGVAVDGVAFEEFLHGTLEYTFTRWLVQELPFEVSSTGNESALRDLYDALPEIDRAEIDGSVSVITREGGSENREQRTFDLVLRDRMGNPLFIAELNDGRDPTEKDTLESLVAHGGDIAESNDSFAGAFAVTASFFEPGALETASDAVGGGLFGRSKRKSFVKLSRKRGYHLCLVESRDGGFHVTVPEL